jgi:hypothetical protein
MTAGRPKFIASIGIVESSREPAAIPEEPALGSVTALPSSVEDPCSFGTS